MSDYSIVSLRDAFASHCVTQKPMRCQNRERHWRSYNIIEQTGKVENSVPRQRRNLIGSSMCRDCDDTTTLDKPSGLTSLLQQPVK